MGQTIKHLKGLPYWPPMLSDEQAAAYTGLVMTDFKRTLANWELPAARDLAGNIRWSRLEIEEALDGTPAALAGHPDRRPLFDPILASIEEREAHR